MKVAMIGSRYLKVNDPEKYLPGETDCIVSGGAAGVDSSAAKYARKSGIPLIEYLPDYEKWGKRAPLLRNLDIVAEADIVVAFWDGRSKGTEFVIKQCRKQGKPISVFMPDPQRPGQYKLTPLDQQLAFNMEN